MVVLGGDVIGLLALPLARAAGAEVLLITRQRAKRDLAVELGAALTAATAAAVLAQWPGHADLVLECAGTIDTVDAARNPARRGSKGHRKPAPAG